MLNIPWVEKYRPTNFDSIVLDNINKKILKNIIDADHFPNLIFYGPPGTGKTTTIINLVNEYQMRWHGEKISECVIHLNASDERGIDVIRNQIQQFVGTVGLFKKGMKFVVLDEVDSMTKTAQQALRFLIQETAFSSNVRFCLICNYISRIDSSLQNVLITLRFNELPKSDIMWFLKNILKNEKIDDVDESDIEHVINMYKSDIRSMINYIQCNHRNLVNSKIFNHETLDGFLKTVLTRETKELLCDVDSIIQTHNISKIFFIKQVIHYSITKNIANLQKLRDIIHNLDVRTDYVLSYLLLKIKTGDILL
jgi:DNA polymerase III delta prime subunit